MLKKHLIRLIFMVENVKKPLIWLIFMVANVNKAFNLVNFYGSKC